MMPILPLNALITERVNIGPVLTLSARDSRTQIALHGATVLSFSANPSTPDSRPVLWLSKDASGANGKAIRGGIPLCAPWFGPHPTAANAPAHGLIRTNQWELLRVEELSDGSLQATLTIDILKNADKGWNHDAKAQFVVTAGKALSLELTVRNTGKDAFLLSEAMHTYFAVSDVRNVSIEGLENSEYLDFSGDGKRHTHGKGPVVLTGEAAHMFYTGRPVRIIDKEWSRTIEIQCQGAASTVVWNPWDKTAATMKDVGEQWPNFICVENANIPDVSVQLMPNTSHHMRSVISVSGM